MIIYSAINQEAAAAVAVAAAAAAAAAVVVVAAAKATTLKMIHEVIINKSVFNPFETKQIHFSFNEQVAKHRVQM